MKKIICILMLVVMTASVLVGCSAGRISEDELREAIRAELEDEMRSGQDKDDTGNSDVPKGDIRDKDGLYGFVKDEIVNITRQDFNTWDIYYFDITRDGKDEAVLISTYGQNWHNKIEIISVEAGKFKLIPSDIYLGKYGNDVIMRDGFLVLESISGGTGAYYTKMSLLIFNNSEVVEVLMLDVSERVSAPGYDYEVKGEIEGSLTNFVHTSTKYDIATGKLTIISKTKYTYNSDTRKFNEEPIEIQDVPTEVSDGIRLSGFSNENINGIQVFFSNYSAVIVPAYRLNRSNNNALAHINITDNSEGMILNFAIFGKLEDVVISRFQWDLEAGEAKIEREWILGDMKDTVVNIYANLQTDMSAYSITGRVHTGGGYWEEVEFYLDDMRDDEDYEVILVGGYQ